MIHDNINGVEKIEANKNGIPREAHKKILASAGTKVLMVGTQNILNGGTGVYGGGGRHLDGGGPPSPIPPYWPALYMEGLTPKKVPYSFKTFGLRAKTKFACLAQF